MKPKVPSRRVLEEAVPRSLKFLRAVRTDERRRSRRLLAARSYDAAGASHRLAVSSRTRQPVRPARAGSSAPDPVVRDAIAAIDPWDEPELPRRRMRPYFINFPEQDAALFAGDLAPTTGVGAVLTVKTFLDRVDALERGSKTDKAAVARLAERGINKDERKRMRAALAQAESAANVVAAGESQPTPAGADSSDLLALYAWYAEWSEVARTIIRRRDHLIALWRSRRAERRSPPRRHRPPVRRRVPRLRPPRRLRRCPQPRADVPGHHPCAGPLSLADPRTFFCRAWERVAMRVARGTCVRC